MTDPRSVQIAPSMMCVDLWCLRDQVQQLEAAGVEMLHFDLMDAHYVPNMPLGLGMLEQLRARTDLPFDAHLMGQHIDFFAGGLATIGVQQVSVHAESSIPLDRTLARTRAHGMRAGVALNPATPLDWLEYVLEQLDFVLIMTVNPGYAGQKLVPAALRKIADCRAFLQRRQRPIPIQVDGNVSFEHIPAMVAAGAGILVGGTSSVFHRGGSIAENVTRVRAVIAQGLAQRHALQANPVLTA